MKYLTVALLRLAVTLGASILCTCLLHGSAEKAANLLEKSLLALREGDFARACAYASQAARQWQASKGLFCAVLDHAETDEIAFSLAELRQSAAAGDRVECRLLCARTAARMRHVEQMELPFYYNFL